MTISPDVRLDAMLGTLDADQREAVTAPLGPVRILAGAGTGKTRTLATRIAYQHHTRVMPQERVLVVTHSARAAAELGHRLAGLGVGGIAVRTFHAAALRQLTHFWGATGKPGTGPRLVSDPTSAIRIASASVSGTRPGSLSAAHVSAVAEEVAWAHARLIVPADYEAAASSAGRDLEPGIEHAAAAYHAYEARKAEQGLLDYDDLLSWCAHLLRTKPDVAAVVRTGYRSILVDEYQDTDSAQEALLSAWLGPNENVCVVGDPTQAIFGFKGADPTLIDTFDQRWPHTRTLLLDTNYRSTPQVVAAANAVARGALTGRLDPLTLAAPRPSGRAVQTRTTRTEDDETALLVSWVQAQLDDKCPASEIAVLCRTNSQVRAMAAELAQARIPVSSRDVAGFFDASEVRRVLRGFAAAAAAEPHVDATTLIAEELDRAGFDEHQPPHGPAAMRRWENMRAVADLVRDLTAHGYDTTQVAVELAHRTSTATDPGRAGVTVTTIHQAKGLEWDRVAVARLVEGSLPTQQAHTAAQLAEEQRLFYVAVTRARDDLLLTCAATSRGRRQQPSRFLTLLNSSRTA